MTAFNSLWEDRRAPFQAFMDALGGLAGAYDIRDGRSDDPMSRVVITVSDWHGADITAGRRIPVAAFEDLLFAVQQLRDRRFAENRAQGWQAEVTAERLVAARDRIAAKGVDMDAFRASLREDFAEAARRADQVDGITGWPAKPGETPNRKATPATGPRTGQPVTSRPPKPKPEQ